MSNAALFIDLRSAIIDTWPDGQFNQAYIVTGTMDQSQDCFKAHYKTLSAIPYITCEITHPDVLHLLTRQASVTRLSLSHELINAELSDHFTVDAIIQWDQRRKTDFYKNIITDVLGKGVNHISLYGLQDFAQWQDIQTVLNGQGLYFYDRFHAARPEQESPYQKHVSHGGNVIALGGWSRITENGVMKVKGPRATEWTSYGPHAQHEELLLLNMSARHGMLHDMFTAEHLKFATASGLAMIKDDYLCPTDLGLWDTVRLVSLLV